MNTDTYMEMLQFMRPAFSVYEEAFIDRYLRRPFKPDQDKYGNLYLTVGPSNKKPKVLWSSHTDTVHDHSGLQGVQLNKKRGIISLSPIAKGWKEKSACLGADCTTGIFIMTEMIKAKVPGLYIFHRDEEAGGHGSRYIAENTPDLLEGIEMAIAFDRKGTNDVITHQSGQTASYEFAESLGKQLGGRYMPSSHGSFTDTRSYAGLIPECTNISVGYEHAHSPRETQDVFHLAWLVESIKKIDTSKLKVKRTPEEPVTQLYGRDYQWPPQTMSDLLSAYPITVASILESHGYTMEGLMDEITDRQARYARLQKIQQIH